MSIRYRVDASRKRLRPHRHRFRKARAPCTEQALASEWQAWVAENLLGGAPPERILEHLSQQGVPHLLAARAITELMQHPALTAARKVTRRGRQLELIQKLLNLQARQAANPHGIERRSTPQADEFFDRYFATNTPVIFTDLVTAWPAYGKWSPEYLLANYGSARIRVTDQRESDPFYDARTQEHTRETSLAEFVARVLEAGESNDFYMVAKNKNISQAPLSELFEDIRLPNDWFESEFLLSSSALWFGPRGTVTPLHHDASSILFCQVYGRKRWRLAAPLETGLLEGAHAMYSGLDPETISDLSNHPVTFKDFVLEPGEALFIPAGYWHHVRSLDVSISLAVNHFARPNDFDAWYVPGALS